MYKTGLLIGRFQPFHKGHLYLLRKALKNADKVIIGIGSANVKDTNNPINFADRKAMIEDVVAHEKINDRVIKIIPLNDFPDDKKWLENVVELAGNFDLAVGNNEWTNSILEKAGYKVLRLDFYKRYLYEGEKIRKLIIDPTSPRLRGTTWENRVPKYLIQLVIENFKLQNENL